MDWFWEPGSKFQVTSETKVAIFYGFFPEIHAVYVSYKFSPIENDIL